MAKHIKVGITHGDYNGIGYEVIIKALDEEGMSELMTPVIFGSERAINYYRKSLERESFRYTRITDAADAKDDVVNLVDTADDELFVEPGKPSETAGKYALTALETAVDALRRGAIDVLVTAPIDKNTIHGEGFDFAGHTEYLESALGGDNSSDNSNENTVRDKALMILSNDNLRVALVTTHVAVSEIARHITPENVEGTIRRFNNSLKRDYTVECPRIAVLALNPHCGDHGVAGKEDDEVIAPVIETLRNEGIMAFGPYAADGFFGSGAYRNFDGIVAMYHDQGLAPFKTLAGTDGINFTAGLKYVRTSPDHGTGYDIAGRNMADPLSMRHAIFSAIDIFRARKNYDNALRNPLNPISADKNERKRSANTKNTGQPAAADTAEAVATESADTESATDGDKEKNSDKE